MATGFESGLDFIARKETVPRRKSSQFLMPAKAAGVNPSAGSYNIYPVCSLGGNRIFNGFKSLAQWMSAHKAVVVDGYAGIFWDTIQQALQGHLLQAGLTVNFIQVSQFLKSPDKIAALVEPFLGSRDAVWGTRTDLSLPDFYEVDTLLQQEPNAAYDVNIIIGTGATLAGWDAPVVYIDLPKNELQFRMRAGAITNLGSDTIHEPFYMYKRSYFVDWVVLNAHKKKILSGVTIMADGQWPDDINWMFVKDLAAGLEKISRSVIRVRPWFEPGAWGGQWIKNNIRQLNKDVVNYAWSFELIVPENGLVFESDGFRLEVSFDTIMFTNGKEVLGKHAAIFGDAFPVRFDFLDTYNGGNLSIQCHPRLQYIQEVFGETITQDETYYILDCQQDASVYLGFQQNINPAEFKTALQTSQDTGTELNIEEYVQKHAARKHDLFLIPNGTIHSAGAGNLVLEISATPYIFTFKMYDWLRLDLDGNTRPINIEHAFQNLDFTRKGNLVEEELISRPAIIDKGKDWQLVHLPTHREHFYDVHRIEFDSSIDIETDNGCHIMMLVEGRTIVLETADGSSHAFAYAETFVVPAAAQSYTLINPGPGRAKVIKAFLK